MSDPHFWQGLDDDDPVPMPVPVWPPPTLGEIRRDAKQARRRRARAWALAEAQARAEARQTYERVTVLPDLTQQQACAMWSDAVVRVAMGVFDECEAEDLLERRNASLARSAAVRAKQEDRWGKAVRALLEEDPTWDAAALARMLRGEKGDAVKVSRPPKKREMATFGRYVSRKKAEFGIK